MLILLDIINSCYCVLLISKLTPSFPFYYLVLSSSFLIKMTFQSNLIFSKIFLAIATLCNKIRLEDIEDVSPRQTFFQKTWHYFCLQTSLNFLGQSFLYSQVILP